ncbi:hypothetical protein [Romboutsia lituseburensis]|uniref:hypothetical protein n=1 Tax=Romboutsia lituseburensis TaxID=1537 RepID=UPI00215B20E6|nr:hypothetical protein [Romboutsia lituseburensis]MCR8747259.1 hypothetical protein [Romboutsia lituseburensis]
MTIVEKKKVTSTEKVRVEIPKVLKKHKQGLNFNDLFNELKKTLKDELVNKDTGEDRFGVLRGIMNKLDTKPVDNMVIEKRGSSIYYVYVDGQLSEIERATKVFLDELKNKDLLKMSLLDLNKNERQRFKEYEELIIKLHDLTYNK